jgi:hypothetical protein
VASPLVSLTGAVGFYGSFIKNTSALEWVELLQINCKFSKGEAINGFTIFLYVILAE